MLVNVTSCKSTGFKKPEMLREGRTRKEKVGAREHYIVRDESSGKNDIHRIQFVRRLQLQEPSC